MHPVINQVTENIQNRSAARRAAYLNQIDKARTKGPQRSILHCGNLAHGFAACAKQDKAILRGNAKANIAIVSAYNDMLSAHQPYSTFPDLIKEAISAAGGVAQFAGGPRHVRWDYSGTTGDGVKLTQSGCDRFIDCCCFVT